MKPTIAINAIYLTSKYQGSGFYSYLLEILKGICTIPDKKLKCRYVLITPEHLNLKKLGIEKLDQIPIPQTSKNYANNIVRHNEFKNNQEYTVLFLPHLELPWRIFIPKNLKLVLLVHDIIPTLFLSPSYIFSGKTPHQLLTRRGLKDYFLLKLRSHTFSKTLTVSEASRSSIKTVFGEKVASNTEIISPGRSTLFKTYSSQSAAITLKNYKIKDKNYLVYFGGYTVRKNVSRLLSVFNQIVQNPEIKKIYDQLKLVLIGASNNDKVKNQIQKLDSSVFVQLPKLSVEELNQIISRALFSVYPSLYEGFGLPLIESIQAGTLPLAADIPTSKEILGSHLPLFNPYQSKDMNRVITESLLGELKTSIHYRQVIKSLSTHIDQFDWNQSAVKLDTVFSQITSK